jgi:hypothetical protein
LRPDALFPLDEYFTSTTPNADQEESDVSADLSESLEAELNEKRRRKFPVKLAA